MESNLGTHSTLSNRLAARQVWVWGRFRGERLGLYQERIAGILPETRYAEVVTRTATFSSNLCFTNVNTRAHMTSAMTGRLGNLGALLRPENYLVVLFAISTTLWTVAFLFYFLSTQFAGAFAAMMRAAHLRRVRE
jgi:hypothetical protein